MDERLISPKELADRTGLPLSWVYTQVEAKKLPHRKLGRYVRFVPSEVNHWIESQRRGPRVEVGGR
jgi:excisionase family DNA binding protein